MHKKSNPKPLKDIILTGVLVGFSMLLVLIATNTVIGNKNSKNTFLSFDPVVNESEAQSQLTSVTAQVSPNNSSYSNIISTDKSKGY